MMIPNEDKKGEQWEMVFCTTALYQIDIMKALLEEENIISIAINKKDSSYLAFGEAELYVKREDALRAKQIAVKFEKHE